MNTPKNTPTPWRVVKRNEQTTISGRRVTVDASSGIVADVDWNTPEANLANASLIVRAVNAHQALLDACRAALAVCGEAPSDQLARFEVGDQLRAAIALALAEGGA